MARVPDGCLVPTGPLAEILDRFFADWKRDRPPTGGQFTPGGLDLEVSPIRAAEWLANEAKLWNVGDAVYEPLSESTIQNIVHRRYRMTEFRVADAIVNALGHPEFFYNGTLQVFPNPAASASARAECCSGSTASASYA